MLKHPANSVAPHDAVYYSLLHSGADFRKQGSKWLGDFSSILEIAKGCGITDVRWHRTINASRYIPADAATEVQTLFQIDIQ